MTTQAAAFNAAGPFSASDTEHDADDECPTLRSIPLGYREPDPKNEGGIVYEPLDGKWHATVPGSPDPIYLGAFSSEAQAQHRLNLFFGRTPALAKTGVRERGGK